MLNKYEIIQKRLNEKNIHTDLITHIKSLSTVKERMNILRGICKDLPVIIVSSGPSSDIDFEKLKEIQNYYIIMSVKYIRDKLLDNGIKIDFTLTSDFGFKFNNVNINEEETISLHICRDKINFKKDIYFRSKQINGKQLHHKYNFQKIIKDDSIEMLIIKDDRILNDYVEFPLVHIMLETAVPMCVFMGITNIYTIGWDGPKDNKVTYFDENLSFQYDIDKIKDKLEFSYIKVISKKFKEYGVNIYKCSEESPIELQFKNIFKLYENIIVIPYRNRETHLDYFIKNTVPLIQEFLPNTRIVVVEQNEGKLFNRGAVLNVGFKEYKDKTKYFFTHDVDLNPTKKCIQEYYIKEVDDTNVLGIYTSQCDTLGGIIKVTSDTIHKINGFPNDIWGWGIEDKALQNRAEYYEITKITNLTNKVQHPLYILRFDDVNDRDRSLIEKNASKYCNIWPKLNNEEKNRQIMNSGLNNLNYTILEQKMIHKIVEIIKVEI